MIELIILASLSIAYVNLKQ